MVSQEKKQKRYKEMEITNVSSTSEKNNVTKGWREGTEGPLQIPSTQWGPEAKEVKVEADDSFQTSIQNRFQSSATLQQQLHIQRVPHT